MSLQIWRRLDQENARGRRQARLAPTAQFDELFGAADNSLRHCGELSCAVVVADQDDDDIERERLTESVTALTQSSRGFDRTACNRKRSCSPLDRLKTYVAAARALLDDGGAIGRRLDFLAQELGREANTLCAKANDVTLTAQGLELRAQIEQFREQVQNIE